MKKFLLIFFMPLMAICQVNETNKLPDLTPVSPKSFEFLKQGDLQISKYTGTPDITIPLYTIQAKGMDVPLVMTYSSTGFRVSEEAGWTGLGWNLSGAGAIVQSVNGFDDFGGIYNNRNIPDLAEIFDIQNSAISGESILNNCSVTLMESNGKYNNQPLYTAGEEHYYYIPVELFEGTKDFQPDIFKFNMPGYSGEFLLDWKNEVFVCLTDNKIKIEPENYSGISSVPSAFAITVPEGHKFTFTLKEETSINMNLSLSDNYPGGYTNTLDMSGKITSRSYQLVTVVTNQGDRIDYEYIITNPIKNLPNISQSVVRYKNIVNSDPFPSQLSDNLTSYNYTQQPYSYISKITFNEGVLLFTLSDRLDQIGTKKLDKIQLRKTVTSPVIKEINFNYNYFTGHTNGTNEDQYLSYGTGAVKTLQELTNRLKLNSVQFTGENPYVFEYNMEPLPKKTSLATDYWGFYNGFLTNQNSFPNLYALNKERGNPLYASYETNNKASSLQHTKAAILEKIIYPTGGYSMFDYELNSFHNTAEMSPYEAYQQFPVSVNSRLMNGLPSIRSLIVENNNTVFTGSAILSTRGCSAADLTNGANDNTYIKIQVFKKELIDYVIEQPNYNGYGLQYVLGTQGFIDGSSPLYNTYIDQVIYLQKSAGEDEKLINNISYNFNRGIVVFSASGGCGTYNGTVNSSQAHLTMSYKGYTIEDTAYGAGLRIKAVAAYDTAGQLISKKRYDYFDGRLLDALLYFSTTQILNYDWVDYNVPNMGTDKHSSGSKYHFNSNNFITSYGQLIGYDRVDEIIISNQSSSDTNGRISDYYINNPNAGILPTMNMSGKRHIDNGFNYKSEIYDSQDELQQRTIAGYTLNKIKCYYGLKQNLKSIQKEGINNAIYMWHLYDVGLKPYTVETISIVSTDITSFLSGSVMQSHLEYQYNSYNQMIHSKETNSNGDVFENYIYYPTDLYTTSPMALQMFNSNVLASVLKQESYVNQDKVATGEMEYYKRLGSNNSFVRPDIYSLSKIKASKGNGILEDRVLFKQYDVLGNNLEVSLPAGSSIFYIWGYNKMYPIAKIENSTYSAISQFMPTLQSLSDADNDRTVDVLNTDGTVSYVGAEGQLRQALSNLRNSSELEGAIVTTYTYDPLVGMTSITDPSGMVIYYHYDAQGKLQYVKDANNIIMEQYQYHFRDSN